MPRKRAELAGKKFGCLTVLRMLESVPGKNVRWECVCECGEKINVSSSNLLAGGQKRTCRCDRVDDLTGQRFGRWLVLCRSETLSTDMRLQWKCECQCESRTKKDVRDKQLRNGQSRSCGCITRDRITKHGAARTPEYMSWKSMIARCSHQASSSYESYGGRGILVCERWRNDFRNFLDDMGLRPHGSTLDRRDPNGNYGPENCHWTTEQEQSQNKRNNRYIECDGQKKILSDWARESGLSKSLILARLRMGWSACKAVTTPARGHGQRKTSARERTWHVWNNMIRRCTKPDDPAYPQWGGRGIKVCDRWNSSFEQFTTDMGHAPEGKSIDRIDVNGNYEPNNCVWATSREQARNTTRNVRIRYGEREQILADWAVETGLDAQTLYRRIYRDGWSVERAMTTPKEKRTKH